jgi:hypothetical protein
MLFKVLSVLFLVTHVQADVLCMKLMEWRNMDRLKRSALQQKYEMTQTGLLDVILSYDGKVSLNSSVKMGGFWHWDFMKTITLPEGVSEIQLEAFEGCKSLERINLPNSLLSIGMWAFGGCESLKNIALPHSLQRISSEAFVDCTGLESLVVPNGLVHIGSQAFENCRSLKSITLPGRLTHIEASIFMGCSALETINIHLDYRNDDGLACFGYSNKERRALSDYLDQGTVPNDLMIANRQIFWGEERVTLQNLQDSNVFIKLNLAYLEAPKTTCVRIIPRWRGKKPVI